jgi:hypothetical protein
LPRWQANNRFGPAGGESCHPAHHWLSAHYFIDAQGRVCHHHFGEGNYEGSERVIQQLLAEAGQKNVASNIVNVAPAKLAS